MQYAALYMIVDKLEAEGSITLQECKNISKDCGGHPFDLKEFSEMLHDYRPKMIYRQNNEHIELCESSPLNLFSEDVLQSLSYPISLVQSTNKLKVTEAITGIVIRDAIDMSTAEVILNTLKDIDYRVKTSSSIIGKVLRYPDKSFQSVFNDILGIRLKVPEYIKDIPSYLRCVDLTHGKQIDDGYRAQHLYYRKDNYHYIIEIQLWSKKDYNFNFWSHSFAYKHTDANLLSELRKKYDNGLITNEAEFRRELRNE